MTSFHRAVAAAILFLIGAHAVALAHEEASIDALAVIDRVQPALEDVDVRVFQLTAPVIVVVNRMAEPLLILGEAGEPFLRISSDLVETNVLSPTAYRAADPTGERPLPDDLDPGAPPEWVVLTHEPTWSWFDPRATYSPGSPDWTIPARAGSESVTIHGSYEPIDGHGHFATRLVEFAEEPGLTLRLLDGSVPAIFVRNTTEEVFQVPGRSGEPFLRIGPRGVFGNVLSPDFYAAGSQTVREVPPVADPDAAPRWKRLSEQPVWQWLEYRARLPASAHQRAALGSERKTVLSWSTPVRLGSDELELAGAVEWLPPRVDDHADHGTRWVTLAGAAAASAALFIFLARLSRRRR